MRSSMDCTLEFFTDAATLAIFDPQRLERRVDDDSDWWCSGFAQLEEVQSGAVALVGLGGDGVYQARITDGDLTPDERDYAAEFVHNLGVEVVSGRLFIGPGECVPGGNSHFTPADAKRGTLFEINNGSYFVDVYAIHWFNSPRWWTADHRPPHDAPADFVVVIRQRTGPIPALDSEPRFAGWSDAFLFESSTRQIGPQPGMILTTKVRKDLNGGLSLKDCGPCDYRASLTDYSQVAWKDTIRFKVLAVDHDAKRITGEFIETVEGT